MTRRIVPCLDVRDGRVVKGVNFQGPQDVSDPVALARRYPRSGAGELVFYDITASYEGWKPFTSILIKMASAVFIPLTVRGGIRGLDSFKRVLACRADRVSVNSGAVRDSVLIGESTEWYGDQCMVLSMDVRRVDGNYHVFLNGNWMDTGLGALEWAHRGTDIRAGEVVVNSMDADGVRGGFDVELLRAVSRVVSVPAVASDDTGSAADFAVLFRTLPELFAGLAASIFHFGEVTIPTLKRVLAEEGVCMRP